MNGRPASSAPVDVPRIRATSGTVWPPTVAAYQTPLVVVGALEDIGASARWTPDYLTSRAGSRTIPLEFSVRPIYRPDPRINGGRYQRKLVTLSDAMMAVTNRRRGAYHYVSTLDVRAYLPELAADVPVPPMLARRNRLRAVYMFVGGAGTGSHTHYDLTENFVAIFSGRKRVLLFPPGQFATFAPYSAVHSLCNMSRINPGREGWPAWLRRKGVTGYECEVGPGELLYIPLHWWHFVRNEELTLGVTYSFDVSLRRRVSWRHARVSLRGRVGPWAAGVVTWADRQVRRHRAALIARAGSRDTSPVSETPAVVGTAVVPLDFVLRHARLTGQLAFARSAARAFVIAREVKRRGIEPDDEAVQEAANAFRRERGLTSARATEQWLADSGLTPEEFEERMRDEVAACRLRDEVTREQVPEFFRTAIAQLETATVSRIRHQDEGVIREIRVIEADGEQDFHALARQCSEDEQTAAAGGYVGAVLVQSLPAPIRDQLRAAAPGDILGPVYHDAAWELYKVEAYAPPVLDEATRDRASRLLFARWLEPQLAGVQVEGLGPAR